MTALDLGVLRAVAALDTAQFDAAYTRTVTRMGRLGGDAEKAAAGVGRLDESLAGTAASADKAGAALSRASRGSAAAGAGSDKAAAAAERQAAAQGRVNELMAMYAREGPRVQAAALRVAAAQERLNAVQETGTATTRQLAGAQASLIASQRSLARAQETSIAGMSRLNKTSAGMVAVGSRMSRTWTLGGAAISALSVKAATDFNSSMTKIRTQAGGTAKDVKVLSGQVLNLAQYAEQGPEELADSLYHLKSVGLDNVSAMKALKEASDLAGVSGADLEDTTNALAGAWRTGIKGATNFHQAVATVNAIVGAGNMRVSDLNAALGTGILASAKTFGLTFKDVGSALALFTDEGVGAQQAATRLRMTFSLLGAPSQAAEKQLNTIGLTGLKLANDMRKPNGLITAIGDLKKHLDASGLSAAEQSQLLSRAFGGGRSSSAILSMINNYDVLAGKQDQVTASLHKYNAAVAAQRKTPEAQFKLLESSLQRTAIILGNELLPSVIKGAHWIGNLFEAFNHLNPTVKTIAGNFVLLLATVGPLLWTVGKLGRAFVWVGGVAMGMRNLAAGMAGVTLAEKAMGSAAYTAGTRIRTATLGSTTMLRNMASKTLTAGGALKSAFGGAAIGATIGLFTRNASTAGKTMGALASTAAGAAAGFAMGGPWGAAIGGAAGLIGDLATSLTGADKAQQQLTADTKTFARTLEASGGKLDKSVFAKIDQMLQDRGLLGQLKQFGISGGEAIADIAKGGDALDPIIEKLQKVAAQRRKVLSSTAIRGFEIVPTDAAKRAQTVLSSLTGLNKAYGQGRHNAQLYLEAQRDAAKGSKGAADATAAVTHNVDLSTSSIRENNQVLAAQLQAMQRVQNAELQRVQTEDAYKQGLLNLNSSLAKNKSTLADNTKAGLQNRQAIEGLISQAQDAAKTMKGPYQLALAGNIQKLITQADKLGVNHDQLVAMLKQMHLIPHDIRTRYHADGLQAMIDQLHAAGKMVGKLQGRHVVTVVYENVGNVDMPVGHGNAVVPGRARGGGLPEGVSAVGEQGPELVVKHGPVAHVLSNPQSKAFLRATGMRAPGFAGGTLGGWAGLVGGILRGASLTPAAIAGFLGNFDIESGGNPRILNSIGALGLAQWLGGRKQRLIARYGPHPSLADEAHFVVSELNGPYHGVKTALRGVHDPERAARIINRSYEISGMAAEAQRENAARHFFERMGGSAGNFGGGGGGGGGWSGRGLPPGVSRHGGKGSSAFWTFQGHRYESRDAAINAWTSASQSARQDARQQAQQQHQAARQLPHDVRGLIHSLDTVSDEKSAFGQLLGDVRASGNARIIPHLRDLNAKVDKAIRKTNKDIDTLHGARTRLHNLIGNQRQLEASVRQAAAGGFDITTAGRDANGKFALGRLRAQQSQYKHILTKWVRDFHKITPIFKKTKTGRAMLSRLAGMDPAEGLPELDALARFPRMDKEIIAQQAAAAKIEDRLGNYIGQNVYGDRIHDQRVVVRRDKRQVAEDRRHLDHEVNRIIHTLEHLHLGVHFDSAGAARAQARGEKKRQRRRNVRKKKAS